jgi:hypothetical protein
VLVCEVSTERQAGNEADVCDARIEALAHDIAAAINTSSIEGREGLREDAISILRNEVQITDRGSEEAGASHPATASFNPFGIGIPLVLMGSVLVFLFPPVGLLMFGVAAIVITWGVGATLLARS